MENVDCANILGVSASAVSTFSTSASTIRPDVRCQMLNVEYHMSNVECQMSWHINVKCQMIKYQMHNAKSEDLVRSQ